MNVISCSTNKCPARPQAPGAGTESKLGTEGTYPRCSPKERSRRMSNERRMNPIVGVAMVVVICLILVAAIFGGVVGCKAFNRSQARAEATNQVKISHIYIEKAHEEALINHAQIEATAAEAQKRIVEAKGIAEATKIVDQTLTPLYVQHEAIQAQKEIATSGQNNTVIYVPAGTNGTPLITQNAQGVSGHTPEKAEG